MVFCCLLLADDDDAVFCSRVKLLPISGKTPTPYLPTQKIENSFYVHQTNNQEDLSGIVIIIGIIFGIAIIGFIVMKNKRTQNQNLKNTARNLSE